MKIFITGGTGFIGKALCKQLTGLGHDLTVLSRNPARVPELCGKNVKAVGNLGELNDTDSFDAIINLAGEGIADARWTKARKETLRNSRIQVTEDIIEFIRKSKTKPGVFISGSAVGYYGNSGDAILNEESDFHDDFGHRLCAEWEQAALQANGLGVRTCIVRTGLVIGNDGGFLQRMLPAFKLGFGGRLGDGKQWMPWIHRDDYLRILEKLLTEHDLSGIFNATSPNPVTNAEFTRCLGSILHRPVFFPVPAFVLKIILGEMSELLLGGQKALPARLQQENLRFEFAELKEALNDVLKKNA